MKKSMIWIGGFLILLTSFACSENSQSHNKLDHLLDEKDGIRAVVNTSYVDDGCDVLLQIDEDGEEVLLLPVDLDEKYKIHGKELLITFHPSRIMQSNCQFGQPVVIDFVKLVD